MFPTWYFVMLHSVVVITCAVTVIPAGFANRPFTWVANIYYIYSSLGMLFCDAFPDNDEIYTVGKVFTQTGLNVNLYVLCVMMLWLRYRRCTKLAMCVVSIIPLGLTCPENTTPYVSLNTWLWKTLALWYVCCLTMITHSKYLPNNEFGRDTARVIMYGGLCIAPKMMWTTFKCVTDTCPPFVGRDPVDVLYQHAIVICVLTSEWHRYVCISICVYVQQCVQCTLRAIHTGFVSSVVGGFM